MSRLLFSFVTTSVLCTTLLLPTKILAHEPGPFDRALADEEQLLSMLERSGKIAPHSSDTVKNNALKTYLAHLSTANTALAQEPNPFAEKRNQYQARVLAKVKSKPKHSQQGSVSVLALQDNVRVDQVLALLIDFPDYPRDKIRPEQSEMYYPSYPQQHFNDLLFSPSGYQGPNGENLISMQQYYLQQSGGTYTVSGKALGWYTASKNAAYYGNNDNSVAVRDLVREALSQLAADPEFDWSAFDKEDRYDYNNNGDYLEPDGMIDHLMIFHSSIGEEAGGGDLGENAIWSHRWNLGQVFKIPGTSHDVGTWDGQYAAFDYTIQPITAAAGVCAHEFGHDLGLPDEYDTSRTSLYGEPVSFWSIMSSGSWAGEIPGAQPVGFSSWARSFLQASIGGQWQNRVDVDLESLDATGAQFVLVQASENTPHTNAVRINLPPKPVLLQMPFDGDYHYHSGQGDDLNHTLTYQITLPTAQNILLSFKTHYEIEDDYDYGRVLVNGQPIAGNITTTDDPNEIGFGVGFTGTSTGWVSAEFDLSPWAGQDIELSLQYLTDGGLAKRGFFVDNLDITADEVSLISDTAEKDSNNKPDHLNGFYKTTGTVAKNHYYLLEWRTHHGVDAGLANIKRYGSMIEFNPGLLIWYVDDSFNDNWVGQHPGQGFLGVVDADQVPVMVDRNRPTQKPAPTVFQMRDATFSKTRQVPMSLMRNVSSLVDYWLASTPVFRDWRTFFREDTSEAGRKIPKYGLRVDIEDQADDLQQAIIRISRHDINLT